MVEAHNPSEDEAKQFYQFSFVVPGLRRPVRTSSNRTILNKQEGHFRQDLQEMLQWNAHTVGRFAAMLASGQINKRTNTDLIVPIEGHGVTFRDPDTLYNRWREVDSGVGEVMNNVMKRFIEKATEPPSFSVE